MILVAAFAFWLFRALQLGNPQPAPGPQPVGPDTLTAKILPRDPATGETMRIERRDESGVLRELEIHFSDRSTGVRYYNSVGRITKVTRRTDAGEQFEGEVSADGKLVTKGEHRDSGGKPVSSFQRISAEREVRQYFRTDGTLKAEEAAGKGSTLWKSYHADGRTVHIETEGGNVRQWLKIYHPDGSLLYEETVSDPNARFGAMLTYNGTVYASGKARRRIIATEGPFSNWYSSVKQVDELAEDGSVTSSDEPLRDGSGFRAKLIDSVLQGIVDSKASTWTVMNDGHLRGNFSRKLDAMLAE